MQSLLSIILLIFKEELHGYLFLKFFELFELLMKLLDSFLHDSCHDLGFFGVREFFRCPRDFFLQMLKVVCISIFHVYVSCPKEFLPKGIHGQSLAWLFWLRHLWGFDVDPKE